MVEARIADLEATLKVARIMDDSDLSLDTVSIGMHVRILAEGDEPDEAEEYDITGSTEADIDQGRISDESPVGAATRLAIRLTLPCPTAIFWNTPFWVSAAAADHPRI